MTKYYLTTPIYYVNAAPHIGTAYSTFVADLVKRFKKMEACDPVVLTTGSDEHSRNVEKAAKAANLDPEVYCSRMVVEFTELWKKLGIKPGQYKAVVSAGEVTWRGLKEKKDAPFKGLGQNCYLISRPDDKSLLTDLDIVLVPEVTEAHFILITSFDTVAGKLEDLDPVFNSEPLNRFEAFSDLLIAPFVA